MTQNLTDTPQWVANVRAPDTGDAANEATFAAGLQDLADRTSFIHQATVAKMTPSASALATAGTITLTAALSYPSGAWGIAANQVQVPWVGVYRVKLNIGVTSASATNPEAAVIHGKVGSSIIKWFHGERFSGTSGHAFTIAGETIVVITDPATQKISLTNESGDAITTVDISGIGGSNSDFHELIVEYLGAAA